MGKFLLEIFVYCAAFVVGRVTTIAEDAVDSLRSFCVSRGWLDWVRRI
jgi:hypothetical protein